MSIDNAPAPLRDALDTLPERLRAVVADQLADFLAEHAPPADERIQATLPPVWAASEFVARTCQKRPALFTDIIRPAGLDTPRSLDDYRARLDDALADVADTDALHRSLRRFREAEMVRIAWRDLAGIAALDDTLAELSALAEACIDRTLAHLYAARCERWGTPRNAAGEAQQLVVLGMGKLGGGELNFSSDIDLVFAYPEAGETDARRPRANEEFFNRLGRELIAALDQQTVDGQAFRVDMRLRPYGSAGPLTQSFRGMEIYYQDQGREWERYALIKARVVGGDYERGAELLTTLRPFIYRRYLDYGAFENLREMKAMVDREVRRRGMADNIKLGRGGIREIEFIGQAFQLIRGGQEPALRERRLLPVLDRLAGQGQIPEWARDELVEGYDFLRRTENRLQAMHDQQTHELPSDSLERQRLAFAMSYEDYERFATDLEAWRQRIQGHFDQVFVAPQEAGEADGAALDFGDVWAATADDDETDEFLYDAGFQRPSRARERIAALREGHSTRSLSARGRARLDRLMPMLLQAVAAQDRADAALERVLALLEAVARRTVYLALLNEHPMALSQLVQLCGASPWIARLLTRHPVLLDELLDPRTLYAPLRREALTTELARRLDQVPADDLEQQMEVLRHFRQANVLRVAAADIAGAIPIMVVSDYLTEIAEVVLEQVLAVAWHHVTRRFGQPTGQVDGEAVAQGFAILAYGKLGGIELGYGSDLDLVFINDANGEQLVTDGEKSVENAVFFARLAQRIIHILSTTTPGGVLYEVDTRLRPSGKSGLLATSLDAFAEYQHRNAWTWEHQALVRARVVAGDRTLAERVEAVRREVLATERDRESLRAEVANMRERMRREKASREADVFDLKQDRGGIADIEFMVQYGVLAGAHANPGLLRFTDNIRLLGELSGDNGLFGADAAERLAEAYRVFRAKIHRLTLQEEPARVPADEFPNEREAVTALWDEIMGAGRDEAAAPQSER
ncbi:bifunctional [glutamate--ammonia ligase]-adenylyl-L-tyrosine phosphorylase/[glutamate--ammonia-ligase] adenylyltransferase [Arhodomonas sp. AD133]|uniref:bifunctional [glutamate--ammonia ligase]-adenylyl-L-tyrosine phosphorylase/[glutamate--ammonia-ligase] adenylyltransferase n=1 Tax=Arhodomonas sp. AD133 TaxID=3415009 RepID=UPI003EBC373E